MGEVLIRGTLEAEGGRGKEWRVPEIRSTRERPVCRQDPKSIPGSVNLHANRNLTGDANKEDDGSQFSYGTHLGIRYSYENQP